MKTTLLFITLAIITPSFLIQAETNYIVVQQAWGRVRIVKSNKTRELLTLRDLEKAARESVESNYGKLPDGIIITFAFNEEEFFLTVQYMSGIGKPAWNVMFDRDGKIVRHEKIILGG